MSEGSKWRHLNGDLYCFKRMIPEVRWSIKRTGYSSGVIAATQHLQHYRFVRHNRLVKKGNTRLIVKRTPTGLGLFAAENIPRGKRIVEYTGPLVPNEVVRKSRGKYYFEVNSRWSIDGSPRGNLARYINHSCLPNADAFVSGRRVWVWSRRAIRAGEEITINYGKDYFEIYIKDKGCRCVKCQGGAAACL